MNNVTFTFCLDSIGLHQVRNPSNVEGAVSLHLYYPPITKCQKYDDTTKLPKEVLLNFIVKEKEK